MQAIACKSERKMTACWTTPAQVDEDFYAMSDFLTIDQPVTPLPQTSARFKATRSKASLYVDEFEHDEKKPPCRPTRGHPLLRGDGDLMPPGGSPAFLQQQYETSKEIREVSGLGYSNDLIEHTLKGERKKYEMNVERMPNIALNKSSSRSSTPSTSPKRVSKGAISTDNQQNGETTKPALYDMLKSRKQEFGASNNVFRSDVEKPLNIYSKTDFPDLK